MGRREKSVTNEKRGQTLAGGVKKIRGKRRKGSGVEGSNWRGIQCVEKKIPSKRREGVGRKYLLLQIRMGQPSKVKRGNRGNRPQKRTSPQ